MGAGAAVSTDGGGGSLGLVESTTKCGATGPPTRHSASNAASTSGGGALVGGVLTAAAGGGFAGGIFAGGSDLHGKWQDPAELAVGLAEVIGGTFMGVTFFAATDSCVGDTGLPLVAPMLDGGGLGGGDLPLAIRPAGGGFGGGVLPLDIRRTGGAFGGNTAALRAMSGDGLEGGPALSIAAGMGSLPPMSLVP